MGKYHPNLSDAEALKTFRLMQRAAEVVLESAAASGPDISLTDGRGSRPFGYNCQTGGGLLLEYFSGAPWKFWTPWGDWAFTGGTSALNPEAWRQFTEDLLPQFGATVHQPIKKDKRGVHGPIYTLKTVEGERLPKVQVISPDEFIPPDQALGGWNALLETI